MTVCMCGQVNLNCTLTLLSPHRSSAVEFGKDHYESEDTVEKRICVCLPDLDLANWKLLLKSSLKFLSESCISNPTQSFSYEIYSVLSKLVRCTWCELTPKHPLLFRLAQLVTFVSAES